MLARYRTLPRPVTVRLTTERVLALAHHALQPDRVWGLPRLAITSAVATDGALTVTYRSENTVAATLSVTGWTGSSVHGSVTRDVVALADTGAYATPMNRWIARISARSAGSAARQPYEGRATRPRT